MWEARCVGRTSQSPYRRFCLPNPIGSLTARVPMSLEEIFIKHWRIGVPDECGVMRTKNQHSFHFFWVEKLNVLLFWQADTLVKGSPISYFCYANQQGLSSALRTWHSRIMGGETLWPVIDGRPAGCSNAFTTSTNKKSLCYYAGDGEWFTYANPCCSPVHKVKRERLSDILTLKPMSFYYNSIIRCSVLGS